MSESMLIGIEIVFNLTYLLVAWGLVLAMLRRRGSVTLDQRRAAGLTIWAFGLLALGDTGHVGFRLVAYALGSLESKVVLFGREISLVGAGALATAITVTLFYVFMLELWRERFQQRYGWFEALLLASVPVRYVLMALPANHWNSVTPPYPFNIIRNLPLMLIGLGVAFLMLRDATRLQDRAFTWIGVSILISYACYMPVIFFVNQVPVLGMLMIPKTMAYVAVGFITYFELFRVEQSAPIAAGSIS